MADPRLLVIAELHGLAGATGELGAVLDGYAAELRGLDGCVSVRVLTAAEPAERVLVVGWAGEAALRAHYATPAYARYSRAVTPLLARPSDVLVHHVSTTVHPRAGEPVDPSRAD